jgi:hypothetical protein
MENQELLNNEPELVENQIEKPQEKILPIEPEKKETLTLRDSLEQALNVNKEQKKEIKLEQEPVKQGNQEEFRLIPKEWNDKEKASFEGLKDNPETVDAYNVLIERYENMRKDYHKKNQDRSELAKKVDLWDNVLDEEAKASLKQKGIEAHDYFKNLLEVEKSLINNPADTIKKIMDIYQIDKSSVFTEPKEIDEGSESDYLDYDKELAKVKEELKAIKERDDLKKQQYQRNQQESTAKTIQDFKHTTDDTGELKYPLFEDVKEEMGLLINQGKAKTLEEAYNNAPTILLKQKEQELQKKAEDDIEKERQKVAKAKRASTGLNSSKSGYNKSFNGSDLRSILSEQLSKYK